MKVGDLVKHINATSLGLGVVTEVDTPSYSAGVSVLWTTKISWPAKPAHIGKTMTWESPRDFEVLNESR